MYTWHRKKTAGHILSQLSLLEYDSIQLEYVINQYPKGLRHFFTTCTIP